MKPPPTLVVTLSLLLAATAPAQQPSLKDVGDIGKVVDSQGVTSLRPTAGARWTHAAVGTPLKPGDWLRTDVRGANALQVKLAGGSELILGPATLIEVTGPGRLTLVRGELEVVPGKDREVIVQPGEGKSYAAREAKVFRHLEGQRGLQVLEKEPNWLEGFKGTVVRESMGQLVAKVDGRDTPLTIGYHKVNVDIRDQIARTTIEESFVNHTNARLEGVFYFPLPQDASISGFGMWINGELVEADVVEKQRAREIYETILREKRDPGLLEWTGGNLFKARVFPIFGNSEKRIKITYTQVLPYRNGSYRYSYALQSEMLRLNPLRELAVNVRVHSALPITKFTCPTHSARINTTANSAQAEFTAQEYTPERDFEVEIEIDNKASPVSVIPHRRGEDGYFLAMITPPDAVAGWQRELVADGEPLQLIVLADTSGSMDEGARANQDALIAALLGSLGKADSFQIAVCDSEVHWLDEIEKFSGAEGEMVRLARNFVAARNSLGWSDLDKAFASAMGRIRDGENTHVIYIGDGVITTGDADPVAFANRLAQLYRGKTATFHAVAPSSSFESGVLNTIASLGGGSVRKIEGSDTPPVVANQLLAEISAPGLRDLKVEFTGLRTARVYPERLPNLAAGRQQIVLGRYLPEGADQTGEIVVSGTRDGKRLTFRAPVVLRDAESGNSFIPRLWSRLHLDTLLAQGRTPEVREEVIALSEEYHIMTPYTSFLVLESDADRERFKVKKRFLMRDGERFFAEGRDNANYELLQKQMRLAGTWRLNLRKGYINELRGIGRHQRIYPPAHIEVIREFIYPTEYGSHRPIDRPWSGALRGGEIDSYSNFNLDPSRTGDWDDGFYAEGKDLARLGDRTAPDDDASEWEEELPAEEGEPSDSAPPPGESDADFAESMPGPAEGLSLHGKEFRTANQLADKEHAAPYGGPGWDGRRKQLAYAAGGKGAEMKYLVGSGKLRSNLEDLGRDGQQYAQRGWHWSHYMQDLTSLFPTYGPAAAAPGERKGHAWPAEAIALADSLLRFDRLAALKQGGVRVEANASQYDARTDRMETTWQTLSLLGGEAWLSSSQSPRADSTVNWWTPKERGVLGIGFRLGRLRTPSPEEAGGYPAVLVDYSFASLADLFSNHQATLEEQADDRALLVLTYEHQGYKSEQRFLIDTARHVVLSHDNLANGALSSRIAFSDWVKAGGCWWPTRARTTDRDGKLTAEQTFAVRALDLPAFDAAFEEALGARAEAVFLHEPLPDLAAAKQAALDGKRRFESEFVLLHHFADSQQWERSTDHFERLAKFAAGKPGWRWLDMRYQAMQRRNEEAKRAVSGAARDLVQLPGDGEFALAVHLRNEAGRAMAQAESHELLQLLQPIYARMPEHTLAQKEWDEAWMWSLQATGRPAEALAAAKTNAEKYPWDANSQTQYANMLANSGDREGALAWLALKIGEPRWTEDERSGFRNGYVNQLQNGNRIEEIKAFLEAWLGGDPQPAYAWPYHQYLAALIRLDEVERAYELLDGWLQAAIETEGDQLAEKDRLRLDAALDFLFGGGYGVQRNTLEKRFHEPLAKIVRKFALAEKGHPYAARIMADYRFHQTDQVRKLRADYTKLLVKRSGELPFADTQRLSGWIMANDPAVEVATWEKIVAPLVDRWSATGPVPERDAWAALIGNILTSQFGAERYTDFLRRQLRESPEEHRGRYAHALLLRLISLPWSEGHESEAFDLLYVIAPASQPAEAVREADLDLLFRAGALMQIDDWVNTSGYSVVYDAVDKKEDLSRTELAALVKDKRSEIRGHLAARLAGELENRDGLDEGLSHWLNIERLYFDIANGRAPGEIAAACWEFLGKFDPLADDEAQSWGEALLITRYLDTIEYLAARPKADAALVERVLALQAEGIAAHPDLPAWKHRQYRLLVALDRPAALKAALRSWIRPGEADSRWRVTLGYLLAELNEIDAAIAEFEAVERADELRPREYRVLADWYLVRDEKAQRERALAGYYGAMPDHQISNLINQRTAQVKLGFENGVPEDLDPEVPVMFTVLMRKSPYPNNYLYQLADLYRYTKDFRMLECMPEGVIGHSAMQVYPFLQTLAAVHNYIGDEATADQIFEHMEKVRARAQTKIDRRGLDLMEMLVRRKASEIINQPGQHLPQALAAMRRAFDQSWDDGERKQMAGFLSALGKISQTPLADEQRREMGQLHRGEKADADRMEIGHLRGKLLWEYEMQDEALEVLEFVLREAEDTAGGTLPYSAQGVLATFLDCLSQRQQFARAEREIFRVLEQDIVAALRHWTYSRKFHLYNAALDSNGSVSIGSGETLYDNATGLIVAALPKVDHQLRYELVQTLTYIHRTAHSKRIGDAAGDAREFAYGAFDDLVPFETSNYQSLVTAVAGTLQELIGYREGLAFLIGRYEKEPASFRAAQMGAWRYYGSTMSNYRYHAKGEIGTLEPRLLKIVLAELRRELNTRSAIYNGIYSWPSNSNFWAAKKDQFARVAEEVLKKQRKSAPTVVYIARYLHDGLHLNARAVEVLVDLYGRGQLDESGWSLLVEYLEGLNRWPEVIQYLVPLVEFRPDNLHYRIRLMATYFKNSQKAQQVATLDAIDQRWHDKGWWSEGTLSALAQTCHGTELWARAVDYYDELIPLHQRAQPNRGIGNGTLSSYFQTLADCHLRLGDTPAAVEAASGAIVSWGSNLANRSGALETLLYVLRKSTDLDGYVGLLEKEVAETGLENPIVRKAVGQIYLEREDVANAIHHLSLAIESQPDDANAHSMLVNSYDLKGDTEGAIRALLHFSKLSRRNIALYQDLGQRYEKLGRAAEAERARTNIVEALPNESEGHALLAQIRQGQNRWQDAAAHWQQVAIIRELEPTGLQRLAEAQLKLGQPAAAAESLKKLLAKNWPTRFGDVHRDARAKLVELEKKAG